MVTVSVVIMFYITRVVFKRWMLFLNNLVVWRGMIISYLPGKANHPESETWDNATPTWWQSGCVESGLTWGVSSVLWCCNLSLRWQLQVCLSEVTAVGPGPCLQGSMYSCHLKLAALSCQSGALSMWVSTVAPGLQTLRWSGNVSELPSHRLENHWCCGFFKRTKSNTHMLVRFPQK